ncbi:TetR family transcriptional regulator [Leptolyngbya sp. 'hensonii']|uniref:TetR family transcriptional regulator n=1 Tax=Leptolyngbya sp. 'hensonii' TaxID=1922337 RepID=UPI00094FEB9D|nr:TetR family transcriptional regulator [Leptolyngbya sp. 'hensonii']OLP16401.1 TetR family transcriptional regulator [Leptolyngbya sp. 'hensonii']
MAAQHKSARQRLVEAALQLFASQGVTETTTRQIADLAGVNEVTLFRRFGSKHGLLLAVLEEAEVFTQLGEALGRQAHQITGYAPALQAYAQGHLQALEQIPEFVRSLVGEAGHYPVENREAIGRGLTQIHHYTTQYLATVMARDQVQSSLTAPKLAGLLNTLLLGYAVVEFTTEFHYLWPNREEFIKDLVLLFLPDAASDLAPRPSNGLLRVEANLASKVLDLPAPVVRAILQQARKSGVQNYALVYVLFGTGLSAGEVANLQRSQAIYDAQQHVLQISQGAIRQVPLNQWIMGYRYGSYPNNPLTQWLKTRKDSQPALFINENGHPLSEVEMRFRWQEITAEIRTPMGQPPELEQAQQTWRVEMLMRGMTPDSLSILCGCTPEQLQPYVQRAQERAALEQAIRLDQPTTKFEASTK